MSKPAIRPPIKDETAVSRRPSVLRSCQTFGIWHRNAFCTSHAEDVPDSSSQRTDSPVAGDPPNPQAESCQELLSAGLGPEGCEGPSSPPPCDPPRRVRHCLGFGVFVVVIRCLFLPVLGEPLNLFQPTGQQIQAIWSCRSLQYRLLHVLTSRGVCEGVQYFCFPPKFSHPDLVGEMSRTDTSFRNMSHSSILPRILHGCRHVPLRWWFRLHMLSYNCKAGGLKSQIARMSKNVITIVVCMFVHMYAIVLY